MTKSSDKKGTSSAPSKSVRVKCSSAAIKKITAEIKKLMTTALDGGKLMGEMLNDQFIENNPILAMMYTFTYIYYSAQADEISQKTVDFTEKYKEVCKLSARELFAKASPIFENDGKSGKTNGKEEKQTASEKQDSRDGQNALSAALADYGEIVDLFLKLRGPSVPHSLRKRREIAPLTDS